MKRRHSGFRPVWLSIWLALCLAGSTSAQSTTGWIRLDSVTNQLSPTQLIAGNTHRVAIRYHFPDEAYSSFWNLTNAFELYSPDGADWSNLVEQNGALIVNCPTHVFFRKYYTSQDDGSTWQRTGAWGQLLPPGPSTGPNSRVAFSVAMVDAGGYACFTSGMDGIMFYLDFQTHSSDIGRTMCVDTVNDRGTVPWDWASAEYGTRLPEWDNGLGESAPRCWEIVNCCQGRVGDANLSGEDEPTVSDVSALIDYLFISGTGLACLEEADVDQTGGINPTEGNITIGDVSALIDYLFITGPESGVLPECL